MQNQEKIDNFQQVVTKLQRKKKIIQEAQLKPKRLLRSRQILGQLQTKKFMNILLLPENAGLIQLLPNEIKSALLNNPKISIEMINEIRIAVPLNQYQALEKVKKASIFFSQYFEKVNKLPLQSEKMVPSTSTIAEQKLEPQDVYNLYLVERIEELNNLGLMMPNMTVTRRNIEFDSLGIKEMDDFYQF